MLFKERVGEEEGAEIKYQTRKWSKNTEYFRKKKSSTSRNTGNIFLDWSYKLDHFKSTPIFEIKDLLS